MLDHQAAVLHDFDARARQFLGGGVVADARLKPYGFRLFGEDILDVRVDVVAAAENIDENEAAGNIDEPAVDGTAEDFFNVGEINRHGNHVETGRGEILRHVESRGRSRRD